VGAFSIPENAHRLAANLEAKGVDAFHFVDTDGLVKVRFGDYATRDDAYDTGRDLQDRGLIVDFFVVSPESYPRDKPGTPDSDIRRELVKRARQFLGFSYRYGGSTPETGFDCSGLVMAVYRLCGLKLPRISRDQFNAGEFVHLIKIQQGDLVFFRTDGSGRISHVGIYIGDQSFIHAPGNGKKVQYSKLTDTYYKDRFAGARRYLGSTPQ